MTKGESKGGKLIERVASGVAWSIGEKIGSALLQVVVSIVVANRIMPEHMGIIAVLSVFITLSQMVVDSGFSQTLIRKAAPTQGDYFAVFRFNIISSVALYVLLTALAPYVAHYYDWPLLSTVAPVIFLVLPLNALGVIQNTIMVREFRFAHLSTITFLSTLISGIVAIAMALMGMGIWSLVGQRIAMMAAKAMLLWWHSEWRPRRSESRGALRSMAPYSLRLMATEIITSLYNNISQLFIGKIYSGTELGYFNQAQKLSNMPTTITQSIQNVTFPALSRIKEDEEKFAESYRCVIMATAMILFPIIAGLIATAKDFYILLLKPDWHPAIPYFRIICVAGFFYPLSIIAYNILKVKSDGAIILRLEIIKRTIMTAILIITIPISVKAIAWGIVVANVCEMLLNITASRRYTNITLWRLVRTLLPIALLTLAMYGIVMWVGINLSEWSTASRLAIKIMAGITVYIIGGTTFRMESFRQTIALLKQILSKR